MTILKAGEVGRLDLVNLLSGDDTFLINRDGVLHQITFTDSQKTFAPSYRSVAGTFTFLVSDYHVEQTTSGVTDTLPASSGSIVYLYSNVSGGNTTLQTTGGEVIVSPASPSGTTSITVLDGETLSVQARPGGGWKLT